MMMRLRPLEECKPGELSSRELNARTAPFVGRIVYVNEAHIERHMSIHSRMRIHCYVKVSLKSGRSVAMWDHTQATDFLDMCWLVPVLDCLQFFEEL